LLVKRLYVCYESELSRSWGNDVARIGVVAIGCVVVALSVSVVGSPPCSDEPGPDGR
jgi:hypothetical protein